MTEHAPPDKKSRSQVKREFRELNELGRQLARLSKGQLAALPLSERTRDALLAARGMTRKSLPRHFRHVTSLLAEEDVDAIRAALP